jgi:hypothetical protein
MMHLALAANVLNAVGGEPKALFGAYRTMNPILKGAAEALLRKPLGDGSGLNAGPTFEFLG